MTRNSVVFPDPFAPIIPILSSVSSPVYFDDPVKLVSNEALESEADDEEDEYDDEEDED